MRGKCLIDVADSLGIGVAHEEHMKRPFLHYKVWLKILPSQLLFKQALKLGQVGPSDFACLNMCLR